jgi:hypothetical protein
MVQASCCSIQWTVTILLCATGDRAPSTTQSKDKKGADRQKPEKERQQKGEKKPGNEEKKGGNAGQKKAGKQPANGDQAPAAPAPKIVLLKKPEPKKEKEGGAKAQPSKPPAETRPQEKGKPQQGGQLKATESMLYKTCPTHLGSGG